MPSFGTNVGHQSSHYCLHHYSSAGASQQPRHTLLSLSRCWLLLSTFWRPAADLERLLPVPRRPRRRPRSSWGRTGWCLPRQLLADLGFGGGGGGRGGVEQRRCSGRSGWGRGRRAWRCWGGGWTVACGPRGSGSRLTTPRSRGRWRARWSELRWMEAEIREIRAADCSKGQNEGMPIRIDWPDSDATLWTN